MTVNTLRNALLWCTLIDYGLLLLWVLLYVTCGESLFRVWRGWFRASKQHFDMLNLGGIVLFKIGVILFNLVPFIALTLAR